MVPDPIHHCCCYTFRMNELSIHEIVAKAKEFAQAQVWHFHYLTPTCIFNDSQKHKVILESNGEVFFSISEERPLKDLEVLEALFYKRI